MKGRIIKGIAGFYYVDVPGSGLYECKAKGVFRNRGMKPLVGDYAEISVIDEENKKGNVDEIYPRSNSLIRPAVANVDQALVIFAATHPTPELNLLDRFLVMMEYQDVPSIIVFNKTDLAAPEEVERLVTTYEKAGYTVLTTSVKEGKGVEAVKEALRGKTTTVAGPSGVGKSSLINERGLSHTRWTSDCGGLTSKGFLHSFHPLAFLHTGGEDGVACLLIGSY